MRDVVGTSARLIIPLIVALIVSGPAYGACGIFFISAEIIVEKLQSDLWSSIVSTIAN